MICYNPDNASPVKKDPNRYVHKIEDAQNLSHAAKILFHRLYPLLKQGEEWMQGSGGGHPTQNVGDKILVDFGNSYGSYDASSYMHEAGQSSTEVRETLAVKYDTRTPKQVVVEWTSGTGITLEQIQSVLNGPDSI
jgi:hypothetical protein